MTSENYVHVNIKGAVFKNLSKNSIWFELNNEMKSLPKSQVLGICTPDSGDISHKELKSGMLLESVEIPAWLASKLPFEVIEQGDSVG